MRFLSLAHSGTENKLVGSRIQRRQRAAEFLHIIHDKCCLGQLLINMISIDMFFVSAFTEN